MRYGTWYLEPNLEENVQVHNQAFEETMNSSNK